MIVRRGEFADVVAQLSKAGHYSVDTETTGLRYFDRDQLFSLIIATDAQSYYFNFQKYQGLADEWVLPRALLQEMAGIFENDQSVFFLHNAKFDLAMLAKEGVRVRGVVHCTEAVGRVLRNDHLTYSLASCAERIGLKKDDAVEKYIAKNKLFTIAQIPGKQKKVKIPHYDRVPWEIITPYGETDAKITHRLGTLQLLELTDIQTRTPKHVPGILQVVENERKLTKTCLAIEQVGILIDVAYTKRALSYEQARARAAMQSFEDMTKIPFQDSRTVLAQAFTKMGEKYPTTEKGNASFTDEVLESFTTPVAQIVRNYRTAAKRANTYFQNFLFFKDQANVIHPNLRQAGTETGRFSCADPNLQNVPKDDSGEFKIRRCFIPRPGFCFVMLDYDQMEYRMMLDYAGEIGVIRQVLGGTDVHTATSSEMGGVERGIAKTINFLLLYGGGALKLARELGVSLEKAKALRALYFRKLPKVQSFIRNVISTAEKRGHVFNWLGRRCHVKREFAYVAPNHLIQGGCADVVKVAMNRLHDYLADKKSRMVLQIHDEVLFEVHESELDIVPELKRIMETVYPHKQLPLTCGVEHSWTSWADKVDGYPEPRVDSTYGEEARNEIQRADQAAPGPTA